MRQPFLILGFVTVLLAACGGHEAASPALVKKPTMQTPLTLGITATISFEIAKKDGAVLESLCRKAWANRLACRCTLRTRLWWMLWLPACWISRGCPHWLT